MAPVDEPKAATAPPIGKRQAIRDQAHPSGSPTPPSARPSDLRRRGPCSFSWEASVGVHREHHLESVSWMEVLAGSSGKRRWSDAMKGRIVTESFGVGRQCQVCCGAVSAEAQSFVVLARTGKLVVPGFRRASFAQVMVAGVLPPPPVSQNRIELVVGSTAVR